MRVQSINLLQQSLYVQGKSLYLPYRFNLTSKDVFEPSFRGYSAKAQRAVSYVKSEQAKKTVNSIYQLDLKKLDGILDGIDLFKGMKTEDLFDLLAKNKINCFCGVPDSLLKDFCAYLMDNVPLSRHTITANEGNAIALAAGHYLATGEPALVYMQNSGLGNCVNPLVSLTDSEVYKIPLIMFVGWRGEPGQKDEPQHVKQGKITDKLLETMDIKYDINYVFIF